MPVRVVPNAMILKCVVILALLKCSHFQSTEEIQYYVDLINDAETSGETYALPENAYEYYSNPGNVKFFGKYDFIVVGSGASGSVIANRLSERNKWTVLVLEAGDFGNNVTDIPNEAAAVQFTKYNWGYKSIPQTTACQGMVDQICQYPRGKGVGGSTLINGLMYVRGFKSDFDNWARLGNPTWSYNEIFPYFKKSENFTRLYPDNPVEWKYHGKGGDLNVESSYYPSPQFKLFLEANKELGYNTVDYNANRLGAAPIQSTSTNGRRNDNGKAFIKPVLYRKNLKVLTQSFVTKVNIDRRTKVAYGVQFSYKNQTYFVRAGKEVILSAGSLGSAQLLLLSGVGPKNHLKSVEIPVIKDLEVGSTLLDHPAFFGLTFDSNYTEETLELETKVKQFLNGYGKLTKPLDLNGIGFYPLSSGLSSIPEIELLLITSGTKSNVVPRAYGLTDAVVEDVLANIDYQHAFSFYILCLHAISSGTLRLKSKNPYEYPLIDSQYLSDPDGKDIATIYEAIELVLKLSKTEAFQSINATLNLGGLKSCGEHEYLSKDYWYCFIRLLTQNMYHPVGSCKMGPNPRRGDVVNYELKVHGVRNLRVADASVFPFSLAGHPAAVCTLIGEKVADFIKNDWWYFQ